MQDQHPTAPASPATAADDPPHLGKDLGTHTGLDRFPLTLGRHLPATVQGLTHPGQLTTHRLELMNRHRERPRGQRGRVRPVRELVRYIHLAPIHVKAEYDAARSRARTH